MRTLAVLLAAIALSACSMAPASTSGTSADFRFDRLTAVEIARTPHSDLLSAIRTLRPRYLNTRGGLTDDGVVSYLDGVRVRGLSVLATVPVEAVVEVRHLSAIDATTRFGTGHQAGAILIITHAGRASTW